MRQKSSDYRRRHQKRQYRYTPGGRFSSEPLRKVLVVLCLTGLLISGFRLCQYILDSWQTQRTNESAAALYHAEAPDPVQVYTARQGATGVPYVKTTPVAVTEPVYQQMTGSPLKRFEALRNANPDIIGWLTIQSELDLPVVYRDNEYYLTRDVYRKKSAAGTLFLDENHPLKAQAQHLVLHGHDMKDGSMFGRLNRYLELDYLTKHGIMHFDTLYQESTYVVFAVLIVPKNVHGAGFINFLGYPVFHSQEQFMDFAKGLKERSKHVIPVDVKANDALLTLSTCYGDDRLLVVARRVRTGESVISLKKSLECAYKQ